MSEPIPAEVMEEARKLLREGNCVACIDDIYCCCFDPLCEALFAAEKRGEQRERDRASDAVARTKKQAEDFHAGAMMSGNDIWSARGAISACNDILRAIRSPT